VYVYVDNISLYYHIFYVATSILKTMNMLILSMYF